jgi:hypothetical protein
MSRSILFTLRAAVAAVAISTIATSAANASFISNSPDPMLGGNRVPLTGVPIDTQFGYATYYVTNIQETSSSVSAGNNYLNYTFTEYFTFYTDPSLTTIATTATFQGQFALTVYGRTSSYETGTFNFAFNSTSSGTVDGDSVSVTTNPSLGGSGTTTMTPGPGLGQYTINTTTTINNQYSINGGAEISTAAISATSVPPGVTSPVPEPSSLVPGAIGIVFVAFARRRLARRRCA